MEALPKFDSIQPRTLRYRGHHKVYLVALLTIAGLLLSFWGYQLSYNPWNVVYAGHTTEIWATFLYYLFGSFFYFFWLRSRLDQAVQVHSSYLIINRNNGIDEIQFEDIESVGTVCWSIFYLKMKNGSKYFFNSSLERADYIWEGVHRVRPELFDEKTFEAFRLKLVQYDHHQQRKEWFLKHKVVDVMNWFIFPIVFIAATYFLQTKSVVINDQGTYFFRLLMFTLLTLIVTAFIFSTILKKFIFDKKIQEKMSSESGAKQRDVEFEEAILQYSKFMQLVTTCFIFAVLIKTNANLFSISRLKNDISSLGLARGQSVIVDNRYNCVDCRYSLREGDVIVFGKGVIGQVIARSGDMVGRVTEDRSGRTIASENVQEVPAGQIAVRLSNDSEVVMVRLNDLIGKVQK